MAEMPAYDLVINDFTGAIHLCVFSGPIGRTDVSVTCQSDDVTEKCLRAVFGHLVISADKAGTDRVTLALSDPAGRHWDLTLSRVVD